MAVAPVAVPAFRHPQAGLDGAHRQAVIEAAALACAIRAHRAGRLADVRAAEELHRPTGGYRGEVAWLVRVADAYISSPVVAAVRAVDSQAMGTDIPDTAVGETGR